MRGVPAALRARVWLAVVALLLITSACSSGSGDSDETLIDPAEAEGASTSSTSTTAPTPSTTEADTSDADPTVAALEEVWTEFYTQVSITDGTAAIEDCSLFSKPLSEFHYIPINGTANVDGVTPFQIQVGEIQAVGTPDA